MKIIGNRAALLLALVTFSSEPVRSETLLLKPVADTGMHEISPNNNMGAHTFAPSGTTGVGTRTRALFRFDLSQLPAGAIINSVSLRFEVTTPLRGTIETATFGLHAVLKSWNEGNKSGNQGTAAGAGEATWSQRTTENWGAPGGQPGVDFVAAASATASVSGAGRTSFSGAGLVSDVQMWQTNPQENFGWVLIAQDESMDSTAQRFASREAGANAPTLQVDYTVQATPLHPADTNKDSQLTIAEITSYAAAWKRGDTWPQEPNPIPIAYVVRAATLWKQGERYRHDPTAGDPPLWWLTAQ